MGNRNNHLQTQSALTGFLLFFWVVGSFGVAIAQEALDAEWLQFEPVITELRGHLTIEEYLGPPGFGENPKTDQKYRVPVLVLDNPVNFRAVPGDDLNENDQLNVSKIQLANFEQDLDFLVGTVIQVRGTIFTSHTGHHITDVVMDLESLPCDAFETVYPATTHITNWFAVAGMGLRKVNIRKRCMPSGAQIK